VSPERDLASSQRDFVSPERDLASSQPDFESPISYFVTGMSAPSTTPARSTSELESFVDMVAPTYEREVGLTPTVHACTATGGASVEFRETLADDRTGCRVAS
jgi:hypothetical protein